MFKAITQYLLFFVSLFLYSYSIAMDSGLEYEINSNIKATSRKNYTQAFESMVQWSCSKLTCNIVNTGGKFYNYAYEGSVEVGKSVGPYGTTTHYKNVPMTGYSKTADFFQCSRCNQHFNITFERSPPIVRIYQKSNTREMTINEGLLTLPMCMKPLLDEDLKRIWIWSSSWSDALEAMWKKARQLDAENNKDQKENVEEDQKGSDLLVFPYEPYEPYKEDQKIELSHSKPKVERKYTVKKTGCNIF